MKNILLLLALTLSSLMSAQQEWTTINTNFGGEYNDIKEVIPIVDNTNGKFAFFMKERKGVTAFYLDEDQNVISEFRVPRLPKKTTIYVGHSIENEKCTLFFRNPLGRLFSSIEFNLKTEEYLIKDKLDISLKKELIVESFSDNETLYILTILKGSSLLKLYSLDVNSQTEVKTIDLSNETFSDFRGSFFNLFLGANGYEKTVRVIDNEPSSLEVASFENKAYFEDGKIILTTDFADRYTYLVEIDVKKGTFKKEEYENKNSNRKELRAKSNSFLFENYFISVYSTTKRLVLDVYDRHSKLFLKEFKIDEEQPISFKNTPIKLEGGDFNKYRELERNRQFLRKVTKSSLGIVAYKQNNNIVLSIGGIEERMATGYIVSAGIIGGAIGGALLGTFGSYTRTKSTRITCLFDEEFNHIQGEIPSNGFDKINNYTKEFKRIQHESIFKYGESYIWGCFYKSTGDYRFVKFE